MSTI
jgi:hypothetical protein